MWQRRRLDREMAEEMRFHLQMEAEREAAKGLPPEEARRAAEAQLRLPGF